MFAKKQFSCVLITCICQFAFAQEFEAHHKAVIWRGFDHDWTYNHRCKYLNEQKRQ